MSDDDLKGAHSRAPISKIKIILIGRKLYTQLMSVDKMLWVSITDDPCIPKNKADNFGKLPKYWSTDETIKESYDLKARNILINLDITKLFGKLTEHENEVKLLTTSEVSLKNKYKVK